MIDAARKSKFKSAGQKREHTSAVKYTALKQKIKKIDSAFFTFRWFEKDKRRDPDNISAGQKYIFDGLVNAGILANDGWSQVLGIEHGYFVDKKYPRVEVEIMGD